MSKTLPPDEPIYQFKLTLLDSNPPIWRRFTVPAFNKLSRLHLIIQRLMGWENEHLYEFTRNEKRIPKSSMIAQIVDSPRSKFQYLYDFGDSWECELLLEKTLPAGTLAPHCLAGDRAAPPEDSGGVWDYQEKVEILRDPSHEYYEEIAEWMGDDYDATLFPLEEINAALAKFQKKS